MLGDAEIERLCDAADRYICPICNSGIEDECDSRIHGENMLTEKEIVALIDEHTNSLGYVHNGYEFARAIEESVRKESAQRIAELEAMTDGQREVIIDLENRLEALQSSQSQFKTCADCPINLACQSDGVCAESALQSLPAQDAKEEK